MKNLLKRVAELNIDLFIREATPSDAQGVVTLMNSHYIRQKNKEYIIWRFFSCPTPSALYVVTTKENTIVGAYGVNIFTLTNGEKCGITADLIISKTYAHRGLFFLLENKVEKFAKKNNCSYLLCMPNKVGMKAHTKIEGWQVLETIPKLVLKSDKIKLLEDYPAIKISDKKKASFEYTKSLLHWRFNKNPEYKYLQVKSGSLQSFIKTFYDTTKNILFGDIVYYGLSSYSKSEFSKLISISVQKLRVMNVQEIITWCSKNSSLFEDFLVLGFIPENQPRYLCVKSLSLNVIDPGLFNWQILPADSDVF